MDPITIALGCATLWTVYMTHKAKDSANAAAARTEATIDINRARAQPGGQDSSDRVTLNTLPLRKG